MELTLNDFTFRLDLAAAIHGEWLALPLSAAGADGRSAFDARGVRGTLTLAPRNGTIDYALSFSAPFRTRLRLIVTLPGQANPFHLIAGNIHGDNNARLVRPNEFPVLAADRREEKNRSPLWEFRADRSSHPVSILCCDRGAVGIAIDPYSDCPDADDGFIRNGLFAALPDRFGVSLGYGNDPLTFNNKTHFSAATAHRSRAAAAEGTIYAVAGGGRRSAHEIIRDLHRQHRRVAPFRRGYRDALEALATAFVAVNYDETLGQYTNRKCGVPTDTVLQPWRCIVEIGWTGGAMLAYPFALAERILTATRFPKPPATILDQICSGFNEQTGLINDTCLNRFTTQIPEGWNRSDMNGWWSGERVPLTRDNHCAYTNAHAAYYLLQSLAAGVSGSDALWRSTAQRVLDTVIDLQRADGAYGYIFSGKRKEVLDYEGFAGCWFAAAMPLAWKLTGDRRYLDSGRRALAYYHPFVAGLAAWGTPMDTCKSVDSEGNLAFVRAARLMHEATGEQPYLDMLLDGANYEYLWRYCFAARPEAPPLKGSNWCSCGGSITSVSNPHIHPMSVVITRDLEYLAERTGDAYHQQRADDGMAWLMNTMELYPEVTGYGRYGVLSERTCPSDGLLEERFRHDGCPSSTWWSYNAWAAGSAMEAVAEQILAGRPEPR